MDRFNLDNGFLITNSRQEQIRTDSKTIQVVPAWKRAMRSP